MKVTRMTFIPNCDNCHKEVVDGCTYASCRYDFQFDVNPNSMKSDKIVCVEHGTIKGHYHKECYDDLIGDD
jgi:hypothetical protein